MSHVKETMVLPKSMQTGHMKFHKMCWKVYLMHVEKIFTLDEQLERLLKTNSLQICCGRHFDNSKAEGHNDKPSREKSTLHSRSRKEDNIFKTCMSIEVEG